MKNYQYDLALMPLSTYQAKKNSIIQGIIDFLKKAGWLREQDRRKTAPLAILVCLLSFDELYKNVLDANPDNSNVKIQFSITRENNCCKVTIAQVGGTGFTSDFLKGQQQIEYSEILGNDSRIFSEKRGEAMLGGSGRALAEMHSLLKQYKGRLVLSNADDGYAQVSLISTFRYLPFDQVQQDFREIQAKYSSHRNLVAMHELMAEKTEANLHQPSRLLERRLETMRGVTQTSVNFFKALNLYRVKPSLEEAEKHFQR